MFAFTHIPKTAGTTLNYILQKNFGNRLNSVIPRKGVNYSYEDLKKDNLIYSNVKCISGHGVKPFINYGEFNNQLKWFTFLRDPIKRFVSQYIHQQTSNLKQYHMPIEEWADRYARSNWQVKWIAGEEDLEAAKQIIKEKFVFIGLTEKFDESLLKMQNVFGNRFDINYKNQKMLSRDNSLKNELLNNQYMELVSFFKLQNELDLKLYDFVLNEIYPTQKVLLENKKDNLTIYNKKKEVVNLYKFRLKRNLIYKPYVLLTK